MATYSKKTCHKCGIRLPQPNMIGKTIQIETGHSRKAFSGTEIFSAMLGSEKAMDATLRTITSPNKRKYVRNKDVWECYKCAGVESPEDKRIRVEKESNETRIRLENERLIKEKKAEEKNIHFAQREEERQRKRAEHAIEAEKKQIQRQIARDIRVKEGSLTRFSLVFTPQFLLSFVFIYIPVSEFYLRRFALSGLKFVLFYVTAILVIGLTDGKNIGAAMMVPLAFGLLDLLSGILFFGMKKTV